MKILKIIHGYPPLYNAGSEVYSQLLSNAEASWLFELTNTVNVFTKAVGTTVFLPINISGESQMIYDSTQPVQLKIVYSESNQILGLSN